MNSLFLQSPLQRPRSVVLTIVGAGVLIFANGCRAEQQQAEADAQREATAAAYTTYPSAEPTADGTATDRGDAGLGAGAQATRGAGGAMVTGAPTGRAAAGHTSERPPETHASMPEPRPATLPSEQRPSGYYPPQRDNPSTTTAQTGAAATNPAETGTTGFANADTLQAPDEQRTVAQGAASIPPANTAEGGVGPNDDAHGYNVNVTGGGTAARGTEMAGTGTTGSIESSTTGWGGGAEQQQPAVTADLEATRGEHPRVAGADAADDAQQGQLVHRIREELAQADELALTARELDAIVIEADGSTIVLSGEVGNRPLAREIEERVRQVAGVDSVENRLSSADATEAVAE
jgi:hypothetical protein